MSNINKNDIITEEAVRDAVWEATEERLQFRQIYQTLNVSGISNDTVTLPKDDDTMSEPGLVRPGGEFPRAEEDASSVTATVQKHGMEVKINKEAIEDSLFDIVRMQVDKAGRKMAELLNDLAYTELSSNLHTNSPINQTGAVNGTLEFSEVIDAREELIGDGYDPDILIVSPSAESDLLNSTEFQRATDLGDDVILNGAIGRVAGFSVFLDNDGHTSANSAYLADGSKYGLDVVKEEIETENYYDDARQAEVYQIWTRRVFKAVDGNAAIEITG